MKKQLLAASLSLLLVGCASTTTSSRTSESTTETTAETTESFDVIETLTSAQTNWNFTSDSVSEEDLETILEAAVMTPSAINAKPWQFNVITDAALIEELADTEGTKTAPVMIIVSVDNSNEMKILDAGLATEAMNIAAQALGYSTKIETAPARTIRNDETGHYADLLDIPEDKSARAALYIGIADEEANADSESSATVVEDETEYVKYYTGE